jgi:predicted dehydrogenase
MTPKHSIAVGIAGLGRSGWNIHVPLLAELPGRYTVAAVFDRNAARRREAVQRLGCRDCASYASLLADPRVELVVVAMPSHLHAAYSIAAMKAGRHVVCEKPMATSLRDADRMIACARSARRVLAVFQNRRYDRDFAEVRRVIRSGALGRIVHARITQHGFGRRWDWQTLKKYGGGTLNNAGPHLLDHALELFGPATPRVFCVRDRVLTLGDADDHVKVVLAAAGAPTVEVEITSACAYPQEHWLVMGSRGTLAGSPTELRWKYFDPKRLSKRVLDEQPTPDRSYNTDSIQFTEKTWRRGDSRDPGRAGFYGDLYDTLRRRKPLVVTPESVRRQMWVLDQCRRQAPV